MGKCYSIVKENEIWTFIFSTFYFCFSFLETFHQDAQTEIVLVNLFQMFTEHGGDRAH